MTTLVLLSLPLSILLVGAIVALVFADVAYSGPAQTKPAAEGVGHATGPTAGALLQMVSGLTLHEGQAITCTDAAFVPRVTPLETDAIIADLTRQGAPQVARVLDRLKTHDGACPLRLTGNVCACTGIRPLECADRCLAGHDSPHWADGLGETMSKAFRQHLQAHHYAAPIQPIDEALGAALAGKTSTAKTSTAELH